MHKAFRVILWVVFSTLLLLIGLGLALQVNSIQNWAVDKVTGYLNDRTSFRTEIGNIRISWWDALTLENLQIYDHRDSLMIGAEKAYADFALLSLIPPGDPTIDAVRLEKAELNLITHSGDSLININRWVKELTQVFGSTKQSTSATRFFISSIELRQSEFALLDLRTDPITEGFDYTRLEFKEVTANADKFSFVGSKLGLDIKLLSGIEGNSGLKIQDLKTNLTYDPKYLELANLNLKTDKSQIKNYLRMDITGPKGYSDFLHQVKLTARMEETKIHLADLRIFAPMLPEIETEIYLSGEVAGPVSELSSEEFLVRIGEKTALFGSFLVDGLPDIDNTYLNLSLKNSVIFAGDLAPYLSPEIQKEIKKFNTIRLDADFAGVLNRFTTTGDFRTNIGNFSGRVNYDLVKGVPSIVSRLKVQNLDLGILTEDKELLQKVSLEGNVNIKGSSVATALVDLNAKISQLGINQYNFTNITTDATYGLNLFRGNLAINDPNLKARVKGYLNLNESIDSVRLNVELDTMFLDRINLMDKETFLSGDLDIDTKGITLDKLEGIARFNNIKAGYEGRELEVGDFFFQSLFAGGTRTLSLNSDYLVVAASGQFNLEQMAKDLDILGRQYLAILLNEEQPQADLEENFSETYSLDLNIRMNDINPLIQLFQPDLSISKNTILEGAFYQTKENTVFNFFTSIDSINYQGNQAYGTNIDFNTSKLLNSKDILASFYVYSKEQKVGENLRFKNLGLEAIWDQTNLDLLISLDQDSTQSKARIEAETKFSTAGTFLKFKPSLLRVLNREWQFDPENLVSLSQGEVTIDKLIVSNEEQELGLQGKISPNPEENLDIIIKQVELDLLNTITSLDFAGKADGSFRLSNLINQAELDGTLHIEGLEINDFPIGEIDASTTLGAEDLILKVENYFNGQKKIDIEGTLGLAYQNLDMDAQMTQANLVIFEPFLSKYITNLGGTVSGNLQLRGTVEVPELLGSGRIDQGKLRINYLNTSYQIDGSILFRPTQISFQDLIFRDINGNRATFTGGLNHQGFENIFLDINSRLSNFQVLNTSARDNELFYGTAFASGTLGIRGSTSNLDVIARATTQANTRISIPLTSSNEQYQEDFIQIINVQDTVRIKALAEEVNRLEIENIRLNFIIDVTPDAFAEIIIDPKTGESIQGRGRGVLNMNIDTQGNFSLAGNYEIVEGLYNFSLYNVVKKKFEVQPGGRITWFGDPYTGVMNLKAFYEESLSLQPLINTNNPAQENSQMRRRFPVKVVMDLQGELLSPTFKFGFDFSEFPSSGDVQTTISAFQNRVAADEQEMNRQVFSVIMTRNFSPEGQFTGVSSLSSSVSNLLSSQLNTALGQVDKNLEVNIDLATLDQNALENFQLSVAYTFLDGRLRVSRDGGFTDNRGNASAASIIGDWQAEYMITEDGVYRLRIFNRNNFNTFTSLSLTQNVLSYGASVTQNVSFNSFSELFAKIARRRVSRLSVQDSDDFLRNEYGGEENWTPITPENFPRREPENDSLRVEKVPAKEDW
ncbi:MAG: translocation/assembly module TamB domain-containing protein [Algoriphagus sp.]|nr:translocation/assembly module TamB domain-containing protein [Algoriphagus sp.]